MVFMNSTDSGKRLNNPYFNYRGHQYQDSSINLMNSIDYANPPEERKDEVNYDSENYRGRLDQLSRGYPKVCREVDLKQVFRRPQSNPQPRDEEEPDE